MKLADVCRVVQHQHSATSKAANVLQTKPTLSIDFLVKRPAAIEEKLAKVRTKRVEAGFKEEPESNGNVALSLM